MIGSFQVLDAAAKPGLDPLRSVIRFGMQLFRDRQKGGFLIGGHAKFHDANRLVSHGSKMKADDDAESWFDAVAENNGVNRLGVIDFDPVRRRFAQFVDRRFPFGDDAFQAAFDRPCAERFALQ